MTTTTTRTRNAAEPVWDIATLFPLQGAWSEEEYLALDTNHLVEFDQGHIEVLPMPTDRHQVMVAALYGILLAYARQVGGIALFAALRVRLGRRKYREPDLVFLRSAEDPRRRNEFWEGADLVMEVVSPAPADRERDLVTKRQDYAQAGIPEYWIVDPVGTRIIVLRLEAGRYVEHGVFGRGETATSATLAGLEAAVDDVLAAA